MSRSNTPISNSSTLIARDTQSQSRPFYLERPLIISGPPGVGKTKVSRFLAQHMRAHWVDLDQLIEKETQSPKLFEEAIRP